jgi:hypothetical protein
MGLFIAVTLYAYVMVRLLDRPAQAQSPAQGLT